MGDTFKREFSLGQIDTGRPYTGQDLQYGQGTATQLNPNAPPVDIPIGRGQYVPGEGSKITITRPSFLSAFLQNLGPSISGAMSAPRGSGVAGGVGGAFKGLEEATDKQIERRRQQQQMDLQQQALQLRTQQEMEIQRLHDEQIKNYASQIQARLNPPAKNQIEQSMRDYSDALAKGDQTAAETALTKIRTLTEAKTPPKAPPSPWGKLSPEMAEVGVPPNPNDKESYPLGMKDPKFQADVQAYGGAVTALKQKRAMSLALARGLGFAQSRAQYQMVPVLDKQNDNMLTYASMMDIGKNPGRYEDASKGASLGAKEAMFQDMNGASENLRAAYTAMAKNGEKFSAGQVTKMTAAMRDDPSGGLLSSVIQNLATAGAKEHLSPTQQAAAIAMLQNYENAFALRGVAGFGQSSDQLRGAIKATLPGPSSPPDYALKQLDAYDAQRERIHRGIPKVSVRTPSGTPPPGANVISLDQFLKQ